MNTKALLNGASHAGLMRLLFAVTAFGQGRGPVLFASLHTALSLMCCAPVPTDPAARAEYERIDDPAEPVNRKIFVANKFVDDNALQPVARGYERTVPGAVRRGIHNFVGNLHQPEVAVNDMLQGNFSRAWNTSERFGVNTTAGGAGMFDVASSWSMPGHDADFGQTLGVWGIGPGPAVQLPLLGPSDARDAVGTVAGTLTNPLGFVGGGAASAVRMASGVLGGVDRRASHLAATDALEESSVDYYATLRSVSAQLRARLVAEGKRGDVSPGASDGSLTTNDKF